MPGHNAHFSKQVLLIVQAAGFNQAIGLQSMCQSQQDHLHHVCCLPFIAACHSLLLLQQTGIDGCYTLLLLQ